MFQSLDSWTRRSKYDNYFCAGELVAGFCRGMGVVLKRFKLADDEMKLKIFGYCVYFYYQEFLQMFDGSDGIWEIAEARILKMVEEVHKLKNQGEIAGEAWEELRNNLTERVRDVVLVLGILGTFSSTHLFLTHKRNFYK